MQTTAVWQNSTSIEVKLVCEDFQNPTNREMTNLIYRTRFRTKRIIKKYLRLYFNLMLKYECIVC